MKPHEFSHLEYNPYKKEYLEFMYQRQSIGLGDESTPELLGKVSKNKAFEVTWNGTDTKEMFEENYKKYPEHLQYYKDNPITYKFNNFRFRNDFDLAPDPELEVDLYLGCSFTMGMGLHPEDNFPYTISKHTGNKCINLGAGGHGMTLSYINLKRFIKFYNVKNVFHYQPVYQRYYFRQPESQKSNELSLHGVYSTTDDRIAFGNNKLFNTEYKLYTLMDWGFNSMHMGLYIDAISQVCNKHNTKYYYFSEIPPIPFPAIHQSKLHNIDYLRPGPDIDIPARDLSHYSVNASQYIAAWFIEVYKKYDSFTGYNSDITLKEYEQYRSKSEK